MIISLENNKRYNGMVNDIRKGLYSHVNSKDFRPMIKELDPEFPLGEDGRSKISMRDITEEELVTHTAFLKTMCIRQGLRLEYFNEGDVTCAQEAILVASVTDGYEEVDDGVLAGVICSNCGCETIRKLTDERYDEIKAITTGDKKESFTPLSASFLCINCIKLKDQE